MDFVTVANDFENIAPRQLINVAGDAHYCFVGIRVGLVDNLVVQSLDGAFAGVACSHSLIAGFGFDDDFVASSGAIA